MNDVVRIMKAADFAARKHTAQRRKGAAAEPYLNHLIEVAHLVAKATEGNPDAVAAALLHDVVEDQAVTIAEIADVFGGEVASIVAEVTDDKGLAKQERKDKQIESAPHKGEIASVVKLADKTSNLARRGEEPAAVARRAESGVRSRARAVVAGLPFKPPALMALFEGAATDAADRVG